MRERDVEKNLVGLVRNAGGLALKFVSPGLAGVPDRLLLFSGGRVAFCEVKAPGQKPRPLQVHRMEQLRVLGFPVYVVDSAEGIREMMESFTEADTKKEGPVTTTLGLAIDEPLSNTPSFDESVAGKDETVNEQRHPPEWDR